MKNKDVNFDDVLKEIARLDATNPKGWTVREMSDDTGKSPNLCRVLIGQLIRADKVYCSGRKKTMAIDATYRYVPVYAFVKTGK